MEMELFELTIQSERVETRGAHGATAARSEAYLRTPQCLAAAHSLRSHAAPKAPTRSDAYRLSQQAHVAQSAERVLGKDEVSGSIPLVGSRLRT